MDKNDLRVFIGPVEISNIGAMLGEALRSKGIKATVVCTGYNSFRAGMTYDEILPPPKSAGFFLFDKIRKLFFWGSVFCRYFFSNDAFLFLFGKTLLKNNYDLPFYKIFGKRTIMWFLGSDIKDIEKRNIELQRLNIPPSFSSDHKESVTIRSRKIRMIRKVEKYVDHIITGPAIAQLLKVDYIGKTLESRIYLPFNINTVRFLIPDSSKPLIVHAPSDDLKKGTPYILESIDALRREGYNFDFRLLKGIPNTEVREILSVASIAIDQLYAFGPGVFALEAMASGCAVLGGNMPAVSNYPQDLPIIHTNPSNIYENLKFLLDHPEKVTALAEEGRKYVEKYHDNTMIAEKVLNLFIS